MSEKEIRSLLTKAERSLQTARRLLDAGDADFAMSRVYYAMFYAAASALLCRGVRRSKHTGVIAAFGEVLVKGGDLPSDLHGALREAFDARSQADYSDVMPSREDVEQRLIVARTFIDAVRGFVPHVAPAGDPDPGKGDA